MCQTDNNKETGDKAGNCQRQMENYEKGTC